MGAPRYVSEADARAVVRGQYPGIRAEGSAGRWSYWLDDVLVATATLSERTAGYWRIDWQRHGDTVAAQHKTERWWMDERYQVAAEYAENYTRVISFRVSVSGVAEVAIVVWRAQVPTLEALIHDGRLVECAVGWAPCLRV